MKGNTLLILAILLAVPAFAFATEQCVFWNGQNLGSTHDVLTKAGLVNAPEKVNNAPERLVDAPESVDAYTSTWGGDLFISGPTAYYRDRATEQWTVVSLKDCTTYPIGGLKCPLPTTSVSAINFDPANNATTLVYGGFYWIMDAQGRWSEQKALSEAVKNWGPKEAVMKERPVKIDALASFVDGRKYAQTLVAANTPFGYLQKWWSTGNRQTVGWLYKEVPYKALGLGGTGTDTVTSVDAMGAVLERGPPRKLGAAVVFATISGNCKIKAEPKLLPWGKVKALPGVVPAPTPEQIKECVVSVADKGTETVGGPIGAKTVRVFDVKVNGAAGKAVKAEAQYGTAAGGKLDCTVSANASGGSTLKCYCNKGAMSLSGVGVKIRQGDYTNCTINQASVSKGNYQMVGVDPCPQEVPQPGPEQITECVVGLTDKGTETVVSPIGGTRTVWKVFDVKVNGAAGKAVRAQSYYGNYPNNRLDCSVRDNGATLWCQCKYADNIKSLYAVEVKIRQGDYKNCTIDTASVTKGNLQTVRVNPCPEKVPESGPEQLAKCTETDNLDDRYVQGTTTGILKSTGKPFTGTDYCNTGNLGKSSVQEYYCDGPYVESKGMTCVRCMDGACK